MHRVQDFLKERNIEPILQIRLLTDPPLILEQEIREKIIKEVNRVSGNLNLEGVAADDLFGPIDALAAKVNKPVFLFAANVDALAHHLARRFLESVQARVTSKKLVVLLSGEDDLRDPISGPKADFNCTEQFVLQGYDKDEFKNVISSYFRSICLIFEDLDEASNKLWRLTDGNIYLARVALWTLIQTRARANVPCTEPVKDNDIPVTIEMIGIPAVYGAHIFRHCTELIARDPKCWSDLQELIDGRTVSLPVRMSGPTRLELAGLVVREIIDKQAYLRFASPLMEAFARKHYDNRRLGDLYAGIGQWDEAFKRYETLPPEGKIRPLGIEDRTEVESTINMLCASLYSKAIEDKAAIKKQFVQGCRYVLGFREVTFWQRSTWQPRQGWQPLVMSDQPRNQKVKAEIAKLLTANEYLLSNPFSKTEPWGRQLPEPLNRFAIAAVIPDVRPDQSTAVVISDLEKQAVISRERERLTRRLLEHFYRAYTHANTVEKLQSRLQTRDKYSEIMNSVFDSLGTDILSTEQVLDRAAEGLHRVPYRRVIFCLVDPEKKRVQGMLTRSDDSDERIHREIDENLDDYESCIYANVIRTKEKKLVKDTANEPLVNKKLVERGGIKSFAVVPIINPIGDAVGAIHIEREDGALPLEHDIVDLITFGGQLAIAIEQIERVNLLESALDNIPEPIVIVDRTKRPRYANRPAADLFEIRSRWRKPVSRQNGLDAEPGERHIADLVKESLERERRLVNHVSGIGESPNYRAAVLTNIILDLQERVAGGFIHVQDFTYLHKVFDGAQRVAESEDTLSALESMLKVAKALDHKWGQLYLLEEEDNDQRFVSRLSFGLGNPAKEEHFNSGNVILEPRSHKGHFDWWCIEAKRPLVYCWKEGLKNNAEFVTQNGLKAINVLSPVQPPEIRKEPNDFWIDFPLIAQDRVLGKLCLQCDDSLRPEEFELLKILSETAAALFASFISMGRRQEMIKVEVAERIIATMAHNIGTRLGSLPPLLGRYELLEPQLAKLSKLNEEFSNTNASLLKTVAEVKLLFAPRISELSTVNLADEITRTLQNRLPSGNLMVELKGSVPEAQVDWPLFETALLELVQNSQDMATDPDRMRVWITIEALKEPNDGDWIRLRYRDNGPGIPDHIIHRIFEDFYSYHPRPEQKPGTGLGLGFARRAIKAHGGKIKAESSSNGAEFDITIPKAPPPIRPKENFYV